MASPYRYSNFQTGTLSPSLGASSTTLHSAELAAFPEITSSNMGLQFVGYWLTLDPSGAHGAPEIVYLTSHAASATTATISRGQQGTTARPHPAGTVWEHAPTASDLSILASPDSQEVFVGDSAAVTQSPAAGNLWLRTDTRTLYGSFQSGVWTALAGGGTDVVAPPPGGSTPDFASEVLSPQLSSDLTECLLWRVNLAPDDNGVRSFILSDRGDLDREPGLEDISRWSFLDLSFWPSTFLNGKITSLVFLPLEIPTSSDSLSHHIGHGWLERLVDTGRQILSVSPTRKIDIEGHSGNLTDSSVQFSTASWRISSLTSSLHTSTDVSVANAELRLLNPHPNWLPPSFTAQPARYAFWVPNSPTSIIDLQAIENRWRVLRNDGARLTDRHMAKISYDTQPSSSFSFFYSTCMTGQMFDYIIDTVPVADVELEHFDAVNSRTLELPVYWDDTNVRISRLGTDGVNFLAAKDSERIVADFSAHTVEFQRAPTRTELFRGDINLSAANQWSQEFQLDQQAVADADFLEIVFHSSSVPTAGDSRLIFHEMFYRPHFSFLAVNDIGGSVGDGTNGQYLVWIKSDQVTLFLARSSNGFRFATSSATVDADPLIIYAVSASRS